MLLSKSDKENYLLFFQSGRVVIHIYDINGNSASGTISSWLAI